MSTALSARAAVRTFLVSVTVAFAWKAQTSTFLHDTRVAAESTEDAAKIVKQASMPTNATAKKMTSTAVKNTTGELFRMQEEIEQLRKQLHKCNKAGSDASVMQMDEELRELQDMLRSLESAEVETGTSSPGANHDQLKVEIEHLRGAIGRLQRFGGVTVELPTATEAPLESGTLRYRIKPRRVEPKVQLRPLADVDATSQAGSFSAARASSLQSASRSLSRRSAAKRSRGPFDVDTEMPYGELEPFGREDTAQELTEASIRESDKMVDQVERAEVAEEKRAVFRALTRLRGAAITSFDGVARSQTGNIDEYNKVHQWRATHPLSHLADEESDVSKWAFPDNAD